MVEPSSPGANASPESALTDAVAPDAPPATRFPIVAIGASAGGLAALSKLLESMSANSGMGFVILTHLDPNRESHMPGLLAKHTSMPVSHAEDREAVQRNHIYVIPPNALLSIEQGVFHLQPLPERPPYPKPIDIFMGALARDQRASSVAIVLSGIDADGTIGLKQVKAEGGMVMVQEPHSAEYEDMPRNAVATGLADFVLPVEQMGPALLNYARHAGLSEQAHSDAPSEAEHLEAILVSLLKGGAPDFRDYKPGMIERRIKHRMGIMGISDLAEFRQRIESSPDTRQSLTSDFLIGVTEFFREPSSWHLLSERILPELFSRAGDRPVRAWVPACATGEEAYSLAMLLSERAPSPAARARIEIFATDVDRQALEHARIGIYPSTITNTISPERLQRFFVPAKDAFQVRKELRSLIVFSPQNLLVDPPFSRMDIVSCRNLLIYLQPAAQRVAASLFAFSLNDGGHLFLGRAENVADEEKLFEEIVPEAHIFRRKPGLRPRALKFHTSGLSNAPGDSVLPAAPLPAHELAQLVERALLARFTPAAVLVNPDFQVLYFHGNVDTYLHRGPGTPTDNLLEMVRNGLAVGIRWAFHQAVEQDSRAVAQADMLQQSEHVRVRISVLPLNGRRGPGSLYLTTFETLPPAHISLATEAAGAEGSDVERELRQTRQEMQEVIERLQQANEELKVLNEESLSANEELQSANEELASSKEEMQSLNEELTTVNAQLEVKVGELEQVNDDLENLLQNTRIGCLFLDRELRVRRYTTPVAQVFSLLPSDLGREISAFASPFAEDDLVKVAQDVLANLTSVGSELCTRNGTWFWRAVQPYETRTNHVDGVVVTFTNITDFKHAEEDVRRLATIMQDSNDAITVHDFEGHILEWNRAAERMYGYSAAEVQALGIMSVVPERHRDEYRSMITRAGRGEAIGSMETQRLTKDGRALHVWLTSPSCTTSAARLTP